jgi:hypothetical protein
MPAGLRGSSTLSRSPETRGVVDNARSVRRLGKDQTVSYTGVVRAVAAGASQIRATARAPHEHGTYAASDDVFLTVGARGNRSLTGIRDSGWSWRGREGRRAAGSAEAGCAQRRHGGTRTAERRRSGRPV